ncbi:small CPxCG-related zinc finger protein [Natrialba magadii ATCC 43099]|uniref:Small CPxCG-related zinc finger protein n=1 Tax=Natrialba magadii (strain ATCC 43099 / DSM 3394 / CCM 3739 / CIP 104546 / IAM 13178 / JCM 8861 / NBRC 102185 / NCIMB 2190 / MS3) TaxID=547559 RepID=D3SX52_NATMM|nr:small CPxCG-related zinc finger protein [Natrialba magadii ATCC 43099]
MSDLENVEPDRWGTFDCPDCGAPCHVSWVECGSCDRPLVGHKEESSP